MTEKTTINFDYETDTYRTSDHVIAPSGCGDWLVYTMPVDGVTGDIMFSGELNDCLKAALDVENEY